MKTIGKKLPYGYKMYNGATMSNPQIDKQNRMTADINRWIDSDREVPEYLLDERHQHFVLCAEINSTPSKANQC